MKYRNYTIKPVGTDPKNYQVTTPTGETWKEQAIFLKTAKKWIDLVEHDKKVKQDMATNRKPSAKLGWVQYAPATATHFVEDLDTIGKLLGSILYEWQLVPGHGYFIRRVS